MGVRRHGRNIIRRGVIHGAAAAAGYLGLSGVPVAAIDPPTPPATSLPEPPATPPCDTTLIALGRDLDRLRRRCARQHRAMLRLGELADRTCAERDIPASLPDHRRNPDYGIVRAEVGFEAGWRRWSRAVDDENVFAERVQKMPAEGLGGLVVKHRALMWDLFHDGGEMGDIAPRRLAAFGRELALADKTATSMSA